MHHGDWITCGSCGEQSIYVFRDFMDWICSVCGGGYPVFIEPQDAVHPRRCVEVR